MKFDKLYESFTREDRDSAVKKSKEAGNRWDDPTLPTRNKSVQNNIEYGWVFPDEKKLRRAAKIVTKSFPLINYNIYELSKFADPDFRDPDNPFQLEILSDIKTSVAHDIEKRFERAKLFESYKNEELIQYTTVMLGGSIGEKPIRSLRDLKGTPLGKFNEIYDSKDDAKVSARKSNKLLSPGEKEYYGISYKVAEVIDGKFTGK
jgi:hypothetical protein